MKETLLIYQVDSYLMSLKDPSIQTVDDARAQRQNRCRYFTERELFSPPRFECVRVAGLKLARRVLECHDEATKKTLELEIGRFPSTAPMPPDRLVAYFDPTEFGCRYITDPGLVLQRVA